MVSAPFSWFITVVRGLLIHRGCVSDLDVACNKLIKCHLLFPLRVTSNACTLVDCYYHELVDFGIQVIGKRERMYYSRLA